MAALCLTAAPSFAQSQGTAVLTGTVTDAATGKPVADVAVTATSPALQGEQVGVTDATGLYRIPQLPPGQYTLRLEGEAYKPYTRGDISLRVDRTIRLNVQLQPESIQAEEVIAVGKAPTVDIGSTTTGLNVGKEFVNNVPFIQPNSTGTRSFEALAAVAPQVNADAYGYSMNGATSPENAVMIDGVSVTDVAYGGLNHSTGVDGLTMSSASLPVEFVEEVNVITGGYMPEFGRSTGGVINAITKSGSNEFHGSVFGTYTPGFLTAQQRGIFKEASTFENQVANFNTGDFGVELGGPIIKDKLWFYVGFAASVARTRERRTLYRLEYDDARDGCTAGSDDDACKVVDGDGNQVRSELPGTTEYKFHDARAYNYLAKLTYLLSSNQRLALSLNGATKQVLTPAFGNKLAGNQDTSDNLSVSLKYTAGFLDKHLLVDATLGWHHQYVAQLPDDGSDIGSTFGAASRSGVIFRRSPAHSILDFERLNPEAAALCSDANGNPDPRLCPATGSGLEYDYGGAYYMEKATYDRLQAKVVVTYLANLLGHHVFKAGVDYQRSFIDSVRDYGGGALYRESAGGGAYREYRQFGYYDAPDNFVNQGGPGNTGWVQRSSGSELGAFLQDSWSLLDVVTINAGLRYDTQQLYGQDGSLGLTLNSMLSPRVGLIYDFTQRGQSKVYASFARYYESIPLNVADRSLSGEYQGGANRIEQPNGLGNGNPGCQPLLNVDQTVQQCRDPRNNLVLASPTEPSQTGLVTGAGKSPVDPNLRPQSSDEYLIGAEYEVLENGRLGVSYTHRNMNAVIEDMSRDEGTTYFIGNPGYGIASDFPVAKRDYDAVSVYFSKVFADLWMAQVSYTWSSLRGNYAGLFRPETGQLNPNQNSDFDLQSLTVNRDGPLPGDITHSLKAFAAKEFVLNGTFSVTLGLSYTGRSGTPVSYLASHPIYGTDETFVLPRGSAGRTPWIHQVNGKLVGTARINKENTVQFSVDVFNMFNFDGAEQVDQRLSNSDIIPYVPQAGQNPQGSACLAGANAGCQSELTKYSYDAAGNVAGTSPVTSADYSPNFKRVSKYQQPLTVRFGLRVTF
ncbi:MAG: TonB-dependent receptor [Myxococcaceae bacterium]|nr:TonB-dependent receptor [Myxococcaceae bacterium]